MTRFLTILHNCVWGVPMLVLILGTGIRLTVKSRFAQFRLFPLSVRKLIQSLKTEEGNQESTSSFRALCTALGATVGTGNLAGVAGAIAIGGPGAVFWMWISALLGMIVKMAESTLAVYYRNKGDDGEAVGGPMYVIRNGLPAGWEPLAKIYCLLGILASFGVGNATQINTLISSVQSAAAFGGWSLSLRGRVFLACVLACMVVYILRNGPGSIGRTAELLIPATSILYLLLGMIVIAVNYERIPSVFCTILKGAVSPRAMTGGVVGSVFLTVRVGISRGVFSNEAGIGTAAIAHASAEVSHPVEQGLMGILEVFLDTIVICTMTALVILCSGIDIPFGKDTGMLLANQAFSAVLGNWTSVPISICLFCFVFATITGWGLYGIRCVEYVFGSRACSRFVLLEGVFALVGALLETDRIWMLAETINGLMAIPNLIAINLLYKQFCILVRQFSREKDALRG